MDDTPTPWCTGISRRELLVTASQAVAAATFLTSSAGAASGDQAAAKPNILWIVCEDLSPILGCYGDRYATTPNLDRFASKSVRFDRAYASSPVCSPARTGLIFGRHACSLGSNNHRSRPDTDPAIRGYAAHLRDLGYWTSNQTKTDYNTSRIREVVADCWDSDGTWRDRPDPSKPFMSVINLDETHASRGMVWGYNRFEREIKSRLPEEEVHDPAAAPLPPWMPDTPTMRRGVARYYDCATAMDTEVGRILADLESDGLADDTIVFFYSDHGTGLPRYKQTALDTGLRVPLLIQFPPQWSHLAPAEAGGATDELVSFVDFGPTVISLAGGTLPATMQGKSFLDPDTERRQYVFGARDRLDEAYDVQRTVTDGRYRYLRNFMPHVPHLQQNNYWRPSEVAQELFDGLREGTLPEESARLFRPKSAAEELYDLEADPWEVNNLAADPAYGEQLQTMRRALSSEMRRVRDLNMVPEAELNERAAGRPLTDLSSDELPLDKIIDAAELVGIASAADIEAVAGDAEPVARWWAAIGLRQLQDADGERALESLWTDEHPLVRGEAGLALLAKGHDVIAELATVIVGAERELATYLCRMAVYSGDAEGATRMLRSVLKQRGDFGPATRALAAIEQLN